MRRYVLIALLLGTALIALEPFGIVMPTEAQMVGAGVLLGLLVFSIGILWQERPADEREESLMNTRGKHAFYAGLAVGSIGIATETLLHRVDWWLVAVVGSMLLIKLYRNK